MREGRRVGGREGRKDRQTNGWMEGGRKGRRNGEGNKKKERGE